jgi:flagellar hook-length control protein FliK
VPSPAALIPATTSRPPLPKTDFRTADQPSLDFGDLIDTSSAQPPPPKDPLPARSDNSRRADAKDNNSQSADASTPPAQDSPPTDKPNPSPEKSPPADSGKKDASTGSAAPDEKAATAANDDANAAAEAADTAAATIPIPATPVVVVAPIVAAALIATQSNPATDGASQAVTPAQTIAAPVGPIVATEQTVAATKAQAVVAAKPENVQSKAAVTTATTEIAPPDQPAEKFGAAVAAAQTPAPGQKSSAKPAPKDAKAAPESTKVNEPDSEIADTDSSGQTQAAVDHAAELLKTLHPVNDGKTHTLERLVEAGTDGKSTTDLTAVAAAASNDQTTLPAPALGVTVGATDANAVKSSDASNAADAAVPLTGLAVEIATRAKDGKNRFEIRLDPPDLGRIDVRLDIDSKGNVTSRLLVERADTLDLLRRDFSGLERALNDAGLKTGDNSMQFAMRDQGFAGGQQQGREFTNVARMVIPSDADAPTGAPRYNLPRLGGVDIRV